MRPASAAKKAYGWPHGPFEIPADIKAEWEDRRPRRGEREEWETRFALLSDNKQAEFRPRHSPARCPSAVGRDPRAEETGLRAAPSVATRKASEMALEVINPILPETMAARRT
jgi:transketolase